MKTVREVFDAMRDYFQRLQLKPERVLAEEVIGAALNIKRLQLYLEFDRPLTEEELEKCRDYLKRRAKREPIQYIMGEADFYHCRLDLTQDVLIPRHETELLVDKIARELKKMDLKGKSLWDVCTGSGCIGIALKKQFPELSVTLSDISPAALKIAKKNCEKNGVEATILEGDLFAPFEGQKCHFFVCNPPYVAAGDYPHLEPEVRDWEPKGALVGGERGLDFYERLAGELPRYLHPGGKAWLEIGVDQGKYLLELFKGDCWREANAERDYAGIDRFFSLEIE